MPQPPGSYTTFAVMNFIIGGIMLICSVCSGIQVPVNTVNNQDVTHQMIQFLNANVPGYTELKIAGAIAGFLFAAGLIVGGIGLLQNSTWGRTLAILFSMSSALHHAFSIIFQVFWVNPAVDRFFAGIPFVSFFPKMLAFGFIVFWSMATVYYLIECIMLAVTPPTPRGYGDDRGPRRDDDVDDYDRPRRRGPSRDDDYDDEPRSRRRWDDDEPRRRRR
ncbi:MAG: hypothetical protein L0Y71_21800 [Gemmataceae bacterium]|nr:hypothetical protein [Gemmataceae bacterium]